MDGHEVVGAHEPDRLLTAEPIDHPAVRLDEAVVGHRQDRCSKLRQDLIDPLGLCGDGRIQPPQRGHYLRLDHDRVRRPVEVAARHEVPADVAPAQLLGERLLDRGFLEFGHAAPSRKRSYEEGIS